jgi:hypothetical protein
MANWYSLEILSKKDKVSNKIVKVHKKFDVL